MEKELKTLIRTIRIHSQDIGMEFGIGKCAESEKKENNPFALHYYFKGNPSQRGYKERMIEIWQECANFQTISQRLADQFRKIIKMGWFSDLCEY